MLAKLSSIEQQIRTMFMTNPRASRHTEKKGKVFLASSMSVCYVSIFKYINYIAKTKKSANNCCFK